jgi:hypothetical protein
MVANKEARSMRKSSSGLTGTGIERILELSADAQINRRGAAKDSPMFHNLTGAIAAYGKALALFAALQQREEFYAIISEFDLSNGVAERNHEVHQYVA